MFFAADSSPVTKVPTADEVVKQLVGDRGGSISLDRLAGSLVAASVKAIRTAQAVATPVSVLVFIIGIAILLFGVLTHNTNWRRVGGGTAVISLVFLVLVKLAPLIIVAVEASVK